MRLKPWLTFASSSSFSLDFSFLVVSCYCDEYGSSSDCLTRRVLHNRELTSSILETAQTALKLEPSKVLEKTQTRINLKKNCRRGWISKVRKTPHSAQCTYHSSGVRSIVRGGWSMPRCPWDFVWYSVTEDATWISKSNICSPSLFDPWISYFSAFFLLLFFYKSHCFHMS